MRIYGALLLGLFTLGGCGNTTTTPTTQVDPAKDNTAVNKRDSDDSTKTPLDQNESSADVKTTAEIRKKVVAESTFSTNAQNVKIITENGVVTLRGPVASEEERASIEKMAKDVAGTSNVENQLEITP